ncbi:MAG: PA0069 family radical SAM protein [Vicinamibacterales bacterium]
MPDSPVQGRGATRNPPGRFELLRLEPDVEPAATDDADDTPRLPTFYLRDASKTILSSNTSPDVPFDRSLNPYRGCEHGCIYCYARPTHEYFGLSAGLDFETRIFVKERAPELLRQELSAPSWKPQIVALSGVTDPYQPIERRLQLTRRCLDVLADFRNPVGIVTKNALVTRDIDVLERLAAVNAVSVSLSITTLDERVRRVMEPRTSTAENRLDAIRRLRRAGIPVGVNVAPIVPGLTDHEIPQILQRAADAGAQFAMFIVLRLPFGVKDLFEAWLQEHFAGRAQKVLRRVMELRGGRLNDPAFGQRMRGTGTWAETFAGVFHKARDRAGLRHSYPTLSVEAFRRDTRQLGLFDD